MSSAYHTPRDRLSEEALAGILSSSDLPGSSRGITPSNIHTPSSCELPLTHRTPIFRPPKPLFSGRVPSSSDIPRGHSTPVSAEQTPTGRTQGPGKAGNDVRPKQHTPISSDSNQHTPKANTARASSSSRPESSSSPSHTGARTPSSGFSSERTLTPGSSISSTLKDCNGSTSDHEQNKDCRVVIQSNQGFRSSGVSDEKSTWRSSRQETNSATTSGLGSNLTSVRSGFESSSSRFVMGRGGSNSNTTKFNFNMPNRAKSASNISEVIGNSSDGSGGYNRCKPNQTSHMSSARNSTQSSSLGNRYPTGSAYSTDRGGSDSSSLRVHSPQAKRPRLGATVHEDDSDDDDEMVEETETQIYLSLMWSHGHLGMAYYDLDTQHIYLMQDSKEDTDLQLTKQVLEQVRPHCVIVSASQDVTLMDVLKAYSASNDSTGHGSDSIHQFVQLLPTLEFSYESSKRRALMLSLPELSEECSEAERSIHISALVPMDKVNMMRAFGGLLKYLDKVRVGIQLEAADMAVPIMAIHTFSLADTMVMDDVSYSALDIFKKAENPSTRIAGWSNESKYSLFGILNRCRSVNGAKLLRLWCLRPTRNMKVLEERQQAIGFFKRSANLEVVSKLRACMAGVRSVARILPQMKRNSVSLKNWKILYKTVYNSIFVGDICSQITPRLPVFQKVSQLIKTEYLQKIAHHINKIADFEEFAKTGMFCVKAGVDEELDRMKRTYNGLPDFMTLVAKKELEQLSEDIQECNVTYLPQLGYLLVIPVTEKMMREDNYEQPNLDFRFVSNGQAFYKNDATVELDNQLGDTESLIQDRQTSIMHQLQDIIISHSPALSQVMDCLAELDCLMGLAMVARDNNYVCPHLTTDNILSFKDGRHPIQEHLCNPFVPNDLESGGDGSSRVKLLTGPNASGKSVYLKQVALIIFMAHIGSYVPAKAATIGLVDRIFTCLKARESLSMGMSSFMIDLNMVSSAVNCCKPNSLVLLDEFGKGTDTVSGMSLLVAMMQQWLEQAQLCPHVLVSTHFHSIGHDKRLPTTPLLQYQTMNSMREGEELVFLYHLVEGCARCSHACHVAAQAGLPREIISRGQEVSELLRKEEAVGRVDTASTATQHDRCKKIVSKFLELDLDKADVESFLQEFVLPVDRGNL